MLSDQCPNCGLKIKSSLLSTNLPMEQKKVDTINLYSNSPKDGYYSKCGSEVYDSALSRLKTEIADLTDQLEDVIDFVPVLSLQSL